MYYRGMSRKEMGIVYPNRNNRMVKEKKKRVFSCGSLQLWIFREKPSQSSAKFEKPYYHCSCQRLMPKFKAYISINIDTAYNPTAVFSVIYLERREFFFYCRPVCYTSFWSITFNLRYS